MIGSMVSAKDGPTVPPRSRHSRISSCSVMFLSSTRLITGGNWLFLHVQPHRGVLTIVRRDPASWKNVLESVVAGYRIWQWWQFNRCDTIAWVVLGNSARRRKTPPAPKASFAAFLGHWPSSFRVS